MTGKGNSHHDVTSSSPQSRPRPERWDTVDIGIDWASMSGHVSLRSSTCVPSVAPWRPSRGSWGTSFGTTLCGTTWSWYGTITLLLRTRCRPRCRHGVSSPRFTRSHQVASLCLCRGGSRSPCIGNYDFGSSAAQSAPTHKVPGAPEGLWRLQIQSTFPTAMGMSTSTPVMVLILNSMAPMNRMD